MELKTFEIEGLNHIFPQDYLGQITKNQTRIISVLSYFATSLFDKFTVEDVLWDVTRNCISKLDLEDCVIYLFDEQKEQLIQKAAYGNKNPIERKILSPITIPAGHGIVGEVAVSGKVELIADVTKDRRYILDDLQRMSELAVPLVQDGRVIGVIDSEHSRPDFFTSFHLSAFALIAELTVKKLEHIKQKTRNSFTNDNAYFQRFIHLLEVEHLYKDESISLSTIAERLNISAGYFSQIINTLSDSNFSDLINQYRVEASKRYLTDATYGNYTVEAIGYEAGFSSPSAFYAAFKKFSKETPTAFRKKKFS
ncbi:MAG: helix-turn-helix domain-containing protein [Gelidibacter sp.]